MDQKQFIKIALISLLINIASIINAVFALFSIVLLIYSLFLVSLRDSDKLVKDKKIFGAINVFMLSILIFMSTIMGVLGVNLLFAVVVHFLSNYKIVAIILAIPGLVVYYYLIIRLLLEAIGIVRQKEVER